MIRIFLVCSLFLIAWNELSAQETAKNTTKIAAGPFKVEVTLDGVFESRSMSEIILRPDEWAELTVKEVVAHGTRVRKGDVILQLDPRKITDAIRELEAGMRLVELTIHQNEVEVGALEPLLPLDTEAAARAKRIASEDLERFNKLERDLTIRQSKEALKRTRQFVEMEEAELRELEKMYKADDLTEETEEIILKRQRDEVEAAHFQLEVAQIEQEKALKIELPRREETLKEAAARQNVLYEKARSALPMAVMKLKLDTEKLKVDRGKSLEKLEKLKRDLAAMTVKAPMDGLLYFGACTLGNWPSSTELAAKLRRGGTLVANDVALTIVDPNVLVVRASVPEKQLSEVRRGVTGRATWSDSEDCRGDVRVESLSAVPIAPGKFTAVLEVANLAAKCSVMPMPGMACTVKLEAYAKKDAIAVPATAVQTDVWDELQRYVNVVGADGKREHRSVSVGRRTDNKVEILAGVKEGETILTTKPEE